MLDLNHPEIHFAIQAVRQAALLVQQVQAELVTRALTKEDRSPVTVADFAAQAVVGRLLSRTFPNDALVAEEDSRRLRQKNGGSTLSHVVQFAGRLERGADAERICAWIDYNRVDSAARFWALDPIDGTKGFLRGDQYATALALVVNGEVQVGALACPNLEDGYRPDLEGVGSLVIAARGQGTWVASLAAPERFERLRVSGRSQRNEARILRSFEAGHTNVDQIDEFARALGVQASPIRMDSQAKYAVLAAGKGDILLRLLSPRQPDYKEKIWDQAAGSLVLEEAGGSITDLAGQPLDFTTGRNLQNNRGILASNGRYHSLALHALSTIGA
jgi:HAL2 family 3'(2'),5'-bisphosphate nucleotidase